MTPYTTAVMIFVDDWNLPSNSFVEVYEFLVAQRNLQLFDNRNAYSNELTFNFVREEKKVSYKDVVELVSQIHNLVEEGNLYLQRKA